jgi:hypothetical protein
MTTGTVYRCEVSLGDDTPCCIGVIYLRWDGKNFRTIQGDVWVGVESSEPVDLCDLPPDWKGVITTEILSGCILPQDAPAALAKLLAMYPRRTQ